MEYYETNSNFIKLNKMFKEAINGTYGGPSSSSNHSNNFSAKRPTPYNKPQNRNNRGNSASNMIPSLLDNISNEQNNNAGGFPTGNNNLPSLFDFQFQNINQKSSENFNSQNVIKMRGLPYSVNINDIKEFFQPLIPLNINLLFGDDGRLSGEAEVEFSTTDDTNEALKYDRRYIGTRYIELFLLSNNDTNGSNNSFNRSKTNYSSNNSNDRPSIPSLFNQIAYFSTQQFMNQNFSNDNDYNSSNSYNNYNNRRQFNHKRGGGKNKTILLIN
jgi:hypothetical protein